MSSPAMAGGALDVDRRSGIAIMPPCARRTLYTPRLRAASVVVPATLVTSPALAHSASVAGGFFGGIAHPLFGADHVAAMVAVGLWGAFLGTPAIVILPVVFPLVMAAGGVLAILGVPLPGVEFGIAVSAVLLGMMVALAARPPLWVAAAMVGVFAIFHGHAHGAELPPGADALAYSAGFVVATGGLHLAGIAFGVLARWPGGRIAVRAAGGLIAIAGLMFLGRLA
jgi:urease accessory protein